MPDFEKNPPRLCVIGEADPFLARLLRRFAEQSGLRTRQAQTGEDVLALAEAELPAVIVVEPELPGKLRGWQAVAALKNDVRLAGIPLILCAWLQEGEAVRLAGPAGAFLQKPDLHFEDFTTALKKAGVMKNNHFGSAA